MVSKILSSGLGYTIETALSVGLAASVESRRRAFPGRAGDLPLVPEPARAGATEVGNPESMSVIDSITASLLAVVQFQLFPVLGTR